MLALLSASVRPDALKDLYNILGETMYRDWPSDLAFASLASRAHHVAEMLCLCRLSRDC